VVIGETAVIGDDCTIYQGVTLGGTRLYKGKKRHPTLEDGVVVGAGAQILGGFVIGEQARIGSNAVVIMPVPAGANAVSNPARIVLKHESTDTPARVRPSEEKSRAPTPVADDAPCQERWKERPLHGLLRTESPEDGDSASSGFSPYAGDASAGDPLAQAIQELIEHAACQEQRINRLCKALEHLGQHIENGDTPLDRERLDQLLN